MSRRNSGGLATALLEVGGKAPWRVTVIAAVTLFVTFHLLASIDVPSTTATAAMGPFVLRHILRSVATILQFLVPGLLLVGALASAIIRKRRRTVHSSVVAAGGGNAIRDLSWREFEQLIGAHFAHQGFAVEETGQSGPDGGIDLKLRHGKD